MNLNQDKIKIYPSTTSETIEVSGYITNPGLLPYKDGLTLKKLLGNVRFGNSTAFECVNNKELNNYTVIKTKNMPSAPMVYIYIYICL